MINIFLHFGNVWNLWNKSFLNWHKQNDTKINRLKIAVNVKFTNPKQSINEVNNLSSAAFNETHTASFSISTNYELCIKILKNWTKIPYQSFYIRIERYFLQKTSLKDLNRFRFKGLVCGLNKDQIVSHQSFDFVWETVSHPGMSWSTHVPLVRLIFVANIIRYLLKSLREETRR